MLQQSGPVETMVLRTSVTARQTAPLERGWSFSSWQRGGNGASCQLWPPGYASAVGICLLVSTRSVQRANAVTLWSPYDVCHVTMPVIA